MSGADDAKAEAGWVLWRQDDNGVRVAFRRFDGREEAEARLREFEALHHKQTYWIAPAGDDGNG